MAEVILGVERLVKRFGGLVATNALSLHVNEAETHALIGPNGAGKTTLIAQLQGELRPDSGTIRFRGTDITAAPPHRRAQLGIARSFQITSVFGEFDAHTNVAMAAQAAQGHSFRLWRPAALDADLNDAAEQALQMLGLAARARVAAQDLSHGERRQLELAMALAMKPALLLLDEPMAGMGRSDSARLTEILASLKQRYAILLVEHDMDVVFALADRVSVLVSGAVIASGTPAQVRADPQVRSAYLGTEA